MQAHRDRLERLVLSLEKMAVAPDDPWLALADSVRAYRDGTEQLSDYSRLMLHRAAVLHPIDLDDDRVAVARWLAALKAPDSRPQAAR